MPALLDSLLRNLKRELSKHDLSQRGLALIAPGSVPFMKAEHPSSESSYHAHVKVAPPKKLSTTQQSF